MELSGSDSPFGADGTPGDARSPREAGVTRFRSLLFEGPDEGIRLASEQPDFFADLNLDQVLDTMTAGRDEYELRPFFYTPLHDPAAVRLRQEVFRDLEKPEVRDAVKRFADKMRLMREHLALRNKLRYEPQKQSWFVEAVEVYCEAVRLLAEDLAAQEIASCGFRGLRDYLGEYVASEPFASLATETKGVKEALAGLRYRVLTDGARVTVSRYEGDGDYSAEVQRTFARFRQGAAKSYLLQLRDSLAMNHVEEQILDRVAKLHPEPFARRASYCARHADYLDATVARFDREVQFYLAYLEMIESLRTAGLPFCYPRVSADSKAIGGADTFDIALADKLVREDRDVVRNDFYLREPERMFVVSGPNNGGKTTFARTFGQLHHLGSLGLLVPGSEAQLLLPDRIYTHFERQEDIETLRGKFDDELVRVRGILEQATTNSVIVMNESFNSTSLNDALLVGTEVMRRILALGCIGVYVTFVDEIASLSEATVSMVTQIVPDNPAERTFKLLRRPADGLAYAWAIAEKYGLTHERLMERIGS